MASNSNIEWTDATWTVTTGCTEKSPGCANCYARTMSKRLAAMAAADIARGKDPGLKRHYSLTVRDDDRWSGVVTPVEDALKIPFGWKKPRQVFVNSMSDLFWGDHEDLADARRRGVKDPKPVPFEFIDKVFAVMALCPQHTFQVLTKRTARMAEYCQFLMERGVKCLAASERFGCEIRIPESFPLPNVWLGTSTENQKTADERIPELLDCPAAVRFLSCEPLLGPLDLRRWLALRFKTGSMGTSESMSLGVPAIHQIIVGGESGPNARPMHPEWARSLRDQCNAAGVAFFFKQWGEHGAGSVDMQTGLPVFRAFKDKTQWINKARTWVNGGVCVDRAGMVCKIGMHFDKAAYPVAIVHRLGKHKAGRLLDGQEWNEMPTTKDLVTA